MTPEQIEKEFKKLKKLICCSTGDSVANNGLISGDGTIQLGQEVNELGDPAILLSDREIPSDGFSVLLTGGGELRIGDSPINNDNTSGTWSIDTGLIVSGQQPSISINMDEVCCVSGNPWAAGSLVWRTSSATPFKITNSIFGDNAVAGIDFHFANTGAGYTSGWGFWQQQNDDTLAFPMEVFATGAHFTGMRTAPSVEVNYCLNVGKGWGDPVAFVNTTGSMNIDANNLPFKFFNLPQHSFDVGYESIIIDPATNLVYRGNAGGGGGGGTPGGSDTQVQYNNSGAFGASAGFVYNNGSNHVTLSNPDNSTGLTIEYNGGLVGGITILSTSASSYSNLTMHNSSNDTGQLFHTGSAFATYRAITPRSLGFYNDGSGGIGIQSDGVGSTVRIGVENNNILTLSTSAATIAGTLATAQPSGSGAGVWRLGKTITAASTLDTTRYVEVMIDGVVVKLALIS